MVHLERLRRRRHGRKGRRLGSKEGSDQAKEMAKRWGDGGFYRKEKNCHYPRVPAVVTQTMKVWAGDVIGMAGLN